VSVERMSANGSGRVTPYFWVGGGDREEFDRALDDAITVSDAVVSEERDGKQPYRVRWKEQVRGVLYVLSGKVASVTSASYGGDAWSLRTLFADRETLSGFHRSCATHDIDM
jgi:hypothetical protein